MIFREAFRVVLFSFSVSLSHSLSFPIRFCSFPAAAATAWKQGVCFSRGARRPRLNVKQEKARATAGRAKFRIENRNAHIYIYEHVTGEEKKKRGKKKEEKKRGVCACAGGPRRGHQWLG